jgi:DNA replication and repair protein RecF
MIVERLAVSNFRNFESLEVSFVPGVNVFFGDNGSGKTNLLEAIFVLCLGRSQRTAADSVLVRQGEDVYRIEGNIAQDGRKRSLAVAYQRNSRKKITLDGIAIRIAELYENVCAVSSGPEDSDILSGSPAIRRTFLDIYMSQYSRAYLDNLKDYHRVLSHKNAALKAQMDTAAFDELLIRYGARIIQGRQEFIQTLSRVASRHYAEIAHGETLDIQYESCVPSNMTDLGTIENALTSALAKGVARERATGLAVVGPHRDDLAITIGDYPARTHGSQGQWRTAAVSLKLSVYELLREKRQVAPVLLLDEIFAELDADRALRLIDAFSGYRQIFLTTAVEPPEPLRTNGGRFRISRGTVEVLS